MRGAFCFEFAPQWLTESSIGPPATSSFGARPAGGMGYGSGGFGMAPPRAGTTAPSLEGKLMYMI